MTGPVTPTGARGARPAQRRVLEQLEEAGGKGLFAADVAAQMDPEWTRNARLSRASEILRSARRHGWATRSEDLEQDGGQRGYRWRLAPRGTVELARLRAGDPQ